MKKIILCVMAFILAIVGVTSLSSCGKNKKADVISTTFVGYDFSRAVIGEENLSCSMLLKPGQEIHSYDPSATDIKAILNCKLFIYVGGESDDWVEKQILNQINKNKTKTISMFQILENNGVNLYEEEDPESADAEEEHSEEHEDIEYDEHVWTNPKYAKMIVDGIKDAIISIDSDNSEKYTMNASSYNEKLTAVDSSYEEIVNNASIKMIVVADRFPLLYFVKAYGLSYDAAFNGCTSDTEASAKTITSLVSKVESNNLKYIFTIELNDKKTIANSICSEVENHISAGKYFGSKPGILTFYTMHNISSDDFNAGKTYIDMSNSNIEALALALN